MSKALKIKVVKNVFAATASKNLEEVDNGIA
jgi:hypothetical protein